ncbi:MAG: nickel pincer cofactor biosynthesis protein LarC, partial [Ignavibacteria bacterium]
MLTALFDIITGISGDMTIAVLIDAGADFNYLKQEIDKLNLKGFELNLTSLKRSQINAAKFDVVIHHQPHYHTHLKDIHSLIDSSALSDFVKVKSKKIFDTIGVAEAKIHNIPIEQIHFHEVGAIDSIVDIVGTCICIENLGIKKIYTTPVKLGKGLINTQHGVMPNPAPATLEILKDYPVEFTNINFELTTPTGAAIVKALSSGIYTNISVSSIKKIGFGSGTFDIPESPNLLRVILCEIEDRLSEEKLLQIETNIDDMNPQVYPYVMERLFEIGARDVYYNSVVMKKGRPGILLSVLAEENLLD